MEWIFPHDRISKLELHGERVPRLRNFHSVTFQSKYDLTQETVSKEISAG